MTGRRWGRRRKNRLDSHGTRVRNAKRFHVTQDRSVTSLDVRMSSRAKLRGTRESGLRIGTRCARANAARRVAANNGNMTQTARIDSLHGMNTLWTEWAGFPGSVSTSFGARDGSNLLIR